MAETQTVLASGFRLSPQQRRVCSLQKAGGGMPYRVQCAISIKGNLDVSALRSAIDGVVGRYEILRTAYAYLPGLTIPVQRVEETAEWSFTSFDFSHWPAERHASEVELLSGQLNQSDFDLEHGSPLRARLISLSESENVLLLMLPALCADKSTMKSLVAAIIRTYEAVLNDEPYTREPMQYADIAEWYNELHASEHSSGAKGYWDDQHLDEGLSLRAPFEDDGPGASRFEPASEVALLEDDVIERIEEVAKSFDSSLDKVLLACWMVLLWRLTAQSRIVVGAAFDNRKYPEIKDALGLLETYLPTHARLNDEIKLSELLGQVGECANNNYRRQEYFGWEGMEDSKADIEPPFFNVCFDFDSIAETYSKAGLTVSLQNIYSCTDRFKLRLFCVRRHSGLAAELHYDSALFDQKDIRRLADHFRLLVKSVSENPTGRISELEIISDKERRAFLFDLNDTRQDYPLHKCAHELFEEQARKTPDDVAVICGDSTLTYNELDRRANQLANHLEGIGVDSEVVVALCLDRSLELAVAMLGVLKSGGAYLPVDPSLPLDRIAFILEDSSASVVLTQKDYLNRFAADGIKTICLDEGWEDVSKQGDQRLAESAGPDNLAYVIYTSGSTGKPKGVMVTHRGLTNYLLWAAEAYTAADTSGSVVHSAIGFDLTVTSLYVPLLAGKAVEMMGGEDSVEELSRGVTGQREGLLVKATPTQAEMMAEQVAARGETARASVYVIGGEALRRDVVERLMRVSPGAKVYNEYGPTEAVVGCSVKEIGESETSGEVSIGRPISNARMYVMGEGQGPVPVGVEGEIYIGGAGLARGYLGRAELTAERFVPDSVSGESGARLYRSGDVGRYAESGEIEYVGRRDGQVKVRGYRIEVGEVESAIRAADEGVKEVAVEARGEGIDKRLVAYIVRRGEEELVVSRLRQRIGERLPAYMVPSEFIMLEHMPVTANGKIDRRALPVPEAVRTNRTENQSSARTPIEDLLAGLWSKILGLDHIAVDDNFFDLGGHSLRATQLIVRVRETLNVDLPLRTLFDSPTLAGFSQAVEAALRSAEYQARPPITRVSRDERMPLSFAQQRLWFIHQLEPDSPAYNLPVGVRLRGPLNVTALERAFNEIVRRHEVLRTTFAIADGEPVQIISPAELTAVPMIDVSLLEESRREEEMQRLAVEDAQRPFDLARGPVLRVHLVQSAPDDAVVLCTMHHIVSDGWSIGVFVREIAELYQAFATGLDSPLPELTVQYADYSHWQRLWLQGEALASQLDYWKEHLAGAPEVLNLPTDWPRTALATYRGANEPWNLTGGFAEQVTALNRQEGVTLFMTLLASLQILLHWYSGEDDIVVGTDVANRTRSQTEDLIGFFINQLVLRTDLSGDPTFRELLSQVRRVTLDAYTHQDIPFDKLVESLNPERSLSYTPLFQVKLVVHNAPASELQLPGLTISAIQTPTGKAKYDLVFNAVESDGSLGGWLEYNTGIFKAATAARILSDFDLLLRSAIASPDSRISGLKEILARANKEREIDQQRELEELRLQKLRSIKRRASRLKEAALVN